MFTWPSGQLVLDIGVSFLGSTIRTGSDDEGPYLIGPSFNWNDPAPAETGPVYVRVEVAQAFADGAWSGSTTVDLLADWFTPFGGSGAATVTVSFRGQVQTKQIAPGQSDNGATTNVGGVTVTSDNWSLT